MGGLYSHYMEKLEALKEGNFEKVRKIDEELKAPGGLYEASEKAFLLSEKLRKNIQRNIEMLTEFYTKN